MININQAVDLLKAGRIVAFPTETVYGLGGDAMNPMAVSKIFAAKKRPEQHPLIVHLAKLDQLNQWGSALSNNFWRLAETFWPGPLTMIVKKQPNVLSVVTGNQATVGLRIPKHPIAQALLQAFGNGIAAPSANRFTALSPTTAAAVEEELGDKVDMILDGGACDLGLESTIIDMSADSPRLLRPGLISADAISAVLGVKVDANLQSHTVRAPGMHLLHYAPRTPTLQLHLDEFDVYIQLAKTQHIESIFLLHSEQAESKLKQYALPYIKLADYPLSYAHDFYHTLRTLDQHQMQNIVIESVPKTQDWLALQDRINKATSKT